MLSLITAMLLALTPQAVDPPPADPPDDPPSLDDLLGIDEEDESVGNTEEAAAAELQRRLDEEVIDDGFRYAILRMKDIARRLADDFDTGIETQRAQEEVMQRLESLMDEARRQQNRNQSSSSQSQQQSTQQNVGQQQRQAQQQATAQQRGGAESQEGESPAPQHGDLDPILDESRSEWGHLPERVREMLLQGRREKFSTLYDRMTREYYRRLAEEGS